MFSREVLGDCPQSSSSRGGASGCPACAAASKLPSVILAASYEFGAVVTITATAYANGFSAPYTGCTRSTHELWAAPLGADSSDGNLIATLTQAVTGTATITFADLTVDFTWLGGQNEPADVAIWCRSYDDCNETYEEDFGVAYVYANNP